jgi:hypothetical protein
LLIRAARVGLALGTLLLVLQGSESDRVWAQPPPASAYAASNLDVGPLPETTYWKQNIFLIPYQWQQTADTSSALSVELHGSKDQGRTWQKVGEAKPHLRAFTYHAEGDGEYCFAIRTIDQLGRAWPAGPVKPELRVIVDTTLPRIEQLAAVTQGNGGVDVGWSIADSHLDSQSLSIEIQINGSDAWQPVPISRIDVNHGVCAGQTSWNGPESGRPTAVRASVSDLAGNRAYYRAPVTQGNLGALVSRSLPPVDNSTPSAPNGYSAANNGSWNGGAASSNASGWSSGGSVQQLLDRSTANQQWPADDVVTGNGRTAPTVDPRRPATTVYGRPPVMGENIATARSPQYEQPRGMVPMRQTATTPLPYESNSTLPQARLGSSPPKDPFHSISNSPAPQSRDDRQPTAPLSDSLHLGSQNNSQPRQSASRGWLTSFGKHLPEGAEPIMVNTTTFGLEYEVESVDRWGVSRVELWGTRDGGQTWRRYSLDDDNRSPVETTVEGDGLYGFRVVVESAGGFASRPPQPGDRPELWVGVDQQRPVVELTSIEQGQGNLADHLILRWRAEDSNLESRPIAIFYSSRPTGPWSAVATGLENTGEYAWRLSRYLPPQFFLRMEARDSAGNLAAYQTTEPIVLNQPQPSGRLRGVQTSVSPTQPKR